MRKEDSTSKDVSKSFVPKRDAESSLKVKGNRSDGATSSSGKTPLKDISSSSLVRPPPAARVEPYSCPSKLAYIREGLTKFSEVSKNKLVDNESTQNLLIKDVELPEVMTDNNRQFNRIGKR